MSSSTKSRDAGRDDCARFQDVLEGRVVEEERLLKEDHRFLEQHLAGCENCAAQFRAVEAMLSLTPSDSESWVHDAARDAARVFGLRIRRRRIAARVFGLRIRRRRIAALSAGAAIVAIAATVLVGVFVIPSPPPGTDGADAVAFDVLRGRIGIANRIVGPGGRIASGDRCIAQDEGALLKLGDNVAVALDSGAQVNAATLGVGMTELALDAGEIAVHVKSGSGIRFVVETPSGRVAVRGTVFAVEVRDDEVQVDVVRGSVQASSPRWPDSIPVTIAAGWSLGLRVRDREPLSRETSMRILAALDMAPLPDAGARLPITEVEIADAAPSEEPPEKRRPAAVPSWESGASGRGQDASQESPTPADLVRKARECRRRRDWTCAAASYRALVDGFPELTEGIVALVPLADIELKQFREPETALAHFRMYLDRRPQGPLAEEALFGVCRALRALGRAADEGRSLEEFLARYPSSVRASRARLRLTEFSAEER